MPQAEQEARQDEQSRRQGRMSRAEAERRLETLQEERGGAGQWRWLAQCAPERHRTTAKVQEARAAVQVWRLD